MGQLLADDVKTLLGEAKDAIRANEQGYRVRRLLIQLARRAPAQSEAWVYAHRHLAERVVAEDPWRASLLARRVLQLQPYDDGAWAILALGQSLLGHLRYAVRAYRRAIRLSPNNPWYAHNLGHLIDVGLGQPAESLALLSRATQQLPHQSEVAASFAHALVRAGYPHRAMDVLKPIVARGATAEQLKLFRWVREQIGTEPRPETDEIRRARPVAVAKRRRLKRRRTVRRGAKG